MLNEDGRGRPEYTEEQFAAWLESMRPFLENSNSIRYSLRLAGLSQHKNVVYQKYREDKEFRDKIDEMRGLPGELVNDTMVTLVRNINDKAKRKEILSSEEIQILKFYGEKARVSQPFFVNRTETAEGQPLEEILDELETNADKGHDELSDEAEKQVVANEPPVQNKEQAGANSDVPAQQNTSPAPLSMQGA